MWMTMDQFWAALKWIKTIFPIILKVDHFFRRDHIKISWAWKRFSKGIKMNRSKMDQNNSCKQVVNFGVTCWIFLSSKKWLTKINLVRSRRTERPRDRFGLRGLRSWLGSFSDLKNFTSASPALVRGPNRGSLVMFDHEITKFCRF